jgi:ArsR family transcriptional regulator
MSKSLPLSDASACAYAPIVREPLSIEAAVALASQLKALADPVRLRLFSMVASRAGREACVCDISEGFDVTQPTISHHLKVLKDAGLLTSERRASWVYYSVVPAALTNLSTVLGVVDDVATGASA